MMGVSVWAQPDYQKRNGCMGSIRRSYAIEVVDTCASGEVDDESRSTVIFTLAGYQPAQLQ